MPWDAEAVAQAVEAVGKSPAGLRFTGVSTDTRQIKDGELFVALRGDRFDAHDFLAQARAAGATGAVVRRGTPRVDGLAMFEVADTLVALGRLARARRRLFPPGTPVIAITGSSGKTSTKEMIRVALAAKYRTHATAANLNNLIGVPLTILSAPADTGALVVEAGASLPGEIPRLREIIEPTIAVITNVGYAHVEGFGSLAGVLQEKVALAVGAAAAIVGTDPPALAVAARRHARTVVAGRHLPAEVRPDMAELDEGGHPHLRWRGSEVTIPVVGFHQIDNAMIALAAAATAGVEPDRCVPALAGVQLPAGRGALVAVGGLTVIDDSYNSNPASLKAAVEFAHWWAGRHRRPLAIVVGSMLELGPESDKLHAAAAREIAGLEPRPALVAAVGAFAPAFEAERQRLGDRLITAPDAGALGPRLKLALTGGEIVLIKASRGVALEQVLSYLR
jgi:UDP-N-acetylmuramoyl-tripeptide--D-alanyl-D-alanine ligase